MSKKRNHCHMCQEVADGCALDMPSPWRGWCPLYPHGFNPVSHPPDLSSPRFGQ